MSNLIPGTWIECKLGDVVAIVRGVTFPASSKVHEPTDGYVACLRTSHIQEKLLWNNIYYIPSSYVKGTDRLAKRNDILMSMANSSNLVGKVCIKETDREACFGAFLSAIRSEVISHAYVYYFLKSSTAQQSLRSSASQTVNIANISVAALENLLLPLAPLTEQTRIAAKLDELLAQVDTLKARIDGIPALLKRFRQSVLAAAVSGRLTEEWRSHSVCSEPNNQPTPHHSETSDPLPTGWVTKTASETCGFITKGTTPPKEKMTAGHGDVPYIKVYNLTFTGVLNFSIDPTFVDNNTHTIDLKRSIVRPGDVLMNIVGPPLGKVSIVPASYPEWNINQAIARFTASDGVSPGYLALCLRSDSVLSYAISRAKATAGQFNLTLEICRELPIPLPPTLEQTEIVRRVEQLFAFAEQIEARVKAAQTRIDHLTQSVLAKAFRGELVPQDPNDEPVGVLLDRIKAQRATAPKAKRGRQAATLG
ncbi:restriction endonuclease subunit S [Pseudomonas simiae]|uniref:restriction endonuclease subunit S n=1 Tax=Pseudomonas simiae TaxID=321846 RepID=UPI0018E6F221|nr:restriction endonuclease subunit S [Pseudomonas simiae]MBJ2229541.1 restriction endonuclease subunit S [Pseudomonas simiae]